MADGAPGVRGVNQAGTCAAPATLPTRPYQNKKSPAPAAASPSAMDPTLESLFGLQTKRQRQPVQRAGMVDISYSIPRVHVSPEAAAKDANDPLQSQRQRQQWAPPKGEAAQARGVPSARLKSVSPKAEPHMRPGVAKASRPKVGGRCGGNVSGTCFRLISPAHYPLFLPRHCTLARVSLCQSPAHTHPPPPVARARAREPPPPLRVPPPHLPFYVCSFGGGV